MFTAVDPEDFGIGVLLTPEDWLSDAIQDGNYPRAYAILRKLDRPLEGSRAVTCLIQCFSRTKKLFLAVLEHLSPEVRTGAATVGSEDRFLQVEGTLLVLAAALGSAAHVQALLERGFDPNAAGPDNARLHRRIGFYRDHGTELPFGPAYRCCAAPGNSIEVRGPAWELLRINGCTPLAAALAAGNILTADYLLRIPGVWKTESSAVCRAAALHADGHSFHAGWVIPWDLLPEDCRPDEYAPTLHADLRATLPTSENMQPGSFADFCSPELLETQYRSGLCTDDDARAVLRALDWAARIRRIRPPHVPPGRGTELGSVAAKLLLTAKHFPKVCREPDMCAVFLRVWLFCRAENQPCDALLKLWRRLAGRDRDISPAADRIFMLRGERLRDCLELLAEGGSLFVSADAVWPGSLAELRELVRRVRIVPSPFRDGVSAFARGVMERSPDLRLLKKLFIEGPLCYEPKEALLRVAGVRARPVILTERFREPEETYPIERVRDSFLHCADLRPEARRAVAEAMLDGDMEEEACLAWLLDPDTPDDCERSRGVNDAFTVMVNGLLPRRMCTAENPNALRAWLRLHPDFPHRAFRSDLIGAGAVASLGGPPLALAAAAGRADNVRVLLAAGADPDACCCAVLNAPDRTLACTPLLLALWFGREAAARALLSAGAVCDLGRGTAYALWQHMPEAGRALALRLPGLGAERAMENDREVRP